MGIKMKAVAMLLLLFTFSICEAKFLEPNPNRGNVHLRGSIVESACSIDTASRYQIISIGHVPIGQLIRDGQSVYQKFSIKLINCTTKRVNPEDPDWQGFTVTFDGQDKNGLFGVNGSVKGFAFQIVGERGNIAVPGVSMPMKSIKSEGFNIYYYIRFVGNGEKLEPGEYHSTVRYKMDYY